MSNLVKKSHYNVAVLGATGAVGTEILALLQERRFPVERLTVLASPRSAGQTLTWGDRTLTVEALSSDAFRGVDIVLASAGGSISKAWLPSAVAAGAVAIDNSSAFRMDPEVPLVVPEVNPHHLHHHRGLIANPNCTTILLCVCLFPLHRVNPVRRVVVATYQSASGAGARAMAEMEQQAREMLAGQPPTTEIFPYPLAFNLFLHNSPLQANGYCQEEMKMVHETRKICDAPDLRLTATCVRVPVLRAHSEAVNLEFAQPMTPDTARQILAQAPGVQLVEDWAQNRFPMPLAAAGQDAVLVGRIRQDISNPDGTGLEFWLSGDQIRKGAALNAVQIAETLIAQA
ncbi:MAG: aspartate-semialdehyde dehydrogenase [Pseudanabaenaceae cyanobacterium]